MRAVLREDAPWAKAGHEVAFGQLQGRATAPPDERVPPLGSLPVDGLQFDVWRAPTDNDEGYHGPEQNAPAWRALGLDRMHHRVLSRSRRPTPAAIMRTRVAAAAPTPPCA